MSYTARNLPHWHPTGKSVFLTWRLQGSLPADLSHKFKTATNADSGKQFRLVDQELDRASTGPLWLKDPRIAEIVVAAIRHGQSVLDCFDMHAFVVMANHVHLLITPKVEIERITKGIKGVSSRRANVILGRTGTIFWQQESFDHWIRNESEMERVRRYIERNPVLAGLVKTPEDWAWSSAARVR
jgi:putative transposase